MDFFISFPRDFRARTGPGPYFLFAFAKVPGEVICCIRLRFTISWICGEEGPPGKP